MTLPKIYPITDARISGISHAAQVQRLVDGGARVIQIREKTITADTFYDDVGEAIRIAHSAGARIIINDRVDIAIALGADGVHLGQDDLPPDEARKMLGDKAIIGFSTHSIEQARAAVQLPIDYIAFGPIFRTDSKIDTEPSVGLEMLRRLRSEIGSMPLVAIGGITAGNLRGVLDAGADSAAIIGAILSSPDGITGKMADFEHLANESLLNK